MRTWSERRDAFASFASMEGKRWRIPIRERDAPAFDAKNRQRSERLPHWTSIEKHLL